MNARGFRNIESFCYCDYSKPMPQSEQADAFCYVIPAIQNAIIDCSCRFGMNKNPKEFKDAIEKIASLVSIYQFKTETGMTLKS